MAVRNAKSIPVHDNLRKAVGYGMMSLAAGTAWARVEGGVHYPSDVLLGAALGNFMARFFTGVFMREREETEIPAVIRIESTADGAVLSTRVLF